MRFLRLAQLRRARDEIAAKERRSARHGWNPQGKYNPETRFAGTRSAAARLVGGGLPRSIILGPISRDL
jgi:hypothetical protein